MTTLTTAVPTPDELVNDHLGLARALAWRYRNRGIPAEDLVQVASLGLVKAAQRFRPESGHEFCAYATPTITGELRRHFRDHGWFVRPPRRLQELRSRLLQEDDAAPDEVVAQRLGASVEEVREARRASNGYSAISLDAPQHAEDDSTVLGDVLAPDGDRTRAVDDLLSLRRAVADLGERDRRILHLRFYEDATQSEIAADLGVSQMQVSRLLSVLLRRLRAELSGDQIPVREVGNTVRPRKAADGAPAWSRMPSSSSTSTSRAA
ncbi:sigma-70 family RNA polymerase sigma factor [Kineococcus sp. SYSU DK003]|uniref:sigma-70 family RNA polymerase sigma factor n=1 Tax=Kineococcus sp. SYSU DK003 TaxID=3383124 RepID=UPI003D7C6576